MNKDGTLKQIENDYVKELKNFLKDNFLLDENYFIDFKLKGLNTVIDAFEKVGEFYHGDDEFKYGKKSVNRNLFGYYFMYREFLNVKKEGSNNLLSKESNFNLKELTKPTNEIADRLFEFIIQYYRENEKSKVKYVNIFYYLTNEINKELYTFKLTQKKYSEIVCNQYGIVIKKFQKSDRYFEDEKPILNKIERAFCKSRS